MDNIYVTKALLPSYEEYIEKIKSLWKSSRITNMGEFHKELEMQLKKYLDAAEISLFTNGHMALELAIQAFHMEGEVITTPFTFVSTTHAIVRNNLTPVFCDINEDDYTIDADKIEALITDKTSAILPVHVYGHICDNTKIERLAKKYNLRVIYDAAHAFGVRKNGESVINYGDASMLSFHATKVFNTVEGGAVIYKDFKIGEELYRLKNFGIRNEETVDGIGANAKLDEFRAAMGLCNLEHVGEAIEKRKVLYIEYLNGLRETPGVRLSDIPEDIEYNYSYFPVYFDEEILGSTFRNDLYDHLKKEGVYTRKYFYPLISDMDCYCGSYASSDTPIAQKVAKGILTLPLYPDLPKLEVERICKEVKKFISNHKKRN